MSSCTFCHISDELKIAQSQHFYALWDIDPIQEGHLLIIAKEHRLSLAGLNSAERLDFLDFQCQLIDRMEAQADVLGVTLAINNGQLMDEGTHFHCHLIPRFKQDGFWDSVSPRQHTFSKDEF